MNGHFARTVLGILTLGISGALAACYFTSSFEGLSNGQLDAAATNPGNTEGGTLADASSSGNLPSGDASALTDANDFCFGAFHCDDFERTGTPQGAWNSVEADNGSTLELTSLKARSGERSLIANIGQPSFARASVIKEIPSFRVFKLSYSIFLEAMPKQSNMTSLEIDYGDHYSQLFFIVNETGIQFAEQEFVDGSQSFYKGYFIKPTVPLNEWIDLSVTIDFSTTPARVTTTINGVIGDDEIPLGRNYPRQKARLFAGVPYAGEGTPYRAFFDRIRIDVTE